MINPLRGEFVLRKRWNIFFFYHTATLSGTVKPVYNDHLMAKGHLDELQKAEIVSKSKLVPSVCIKTH